MDPHGAHSLAIRGGLIASFDGQTGLDSMNIVKICVYDGADTFCEQLINLLECGVAPS